MGAINPQALLISSATHGLKAKPPVKKIASTFPSKTVAQAPISLAT